MSAAAGIALLTLIAQVESAGQTRVLLLDDCPNGLEGFYAPSRNRIGLCRNNHSSDAALSSTLLHEAMHRLQHCRQPELAAQLDAEQRVGVIRAVTGGKNMLVGGTAIFVYHDAVVARQTGLLRKF